MRSTTLVEPEFAACFIPIPIILRKEIRHPFFLKIIYKEDTTFFSGSNFALEIILYGAFSLDQ